MELTDARIIVAGATGELGSALARALKDEGAQLALAGRNAERLDALGDELGAPVARFDAEQPAGCKSAVDALAAALGGVDAILVLPGVTAFGAADELSQTTIDRLFAVNALGPMALIASALGHIDGKGAVVAITAITVDYPTAGIAHYSAAKSALSAYLKAVRHERRRHGLSVIDVRPPHLDTGFSDRGLAGEPPLLPEPVAHGLVVDATVDALRNGRREVTWDLKARALSVA